MWRRWSARPCFSPGHSWWNPPDVEDGSATHSYERATSRARRPSGRRCWQPTAFAGRAKTRFWEEEASRFMVPATVIPVRFSDIVTFRPGACRRWGGALSEVECKGGAAAERPGPKSVPETTRRLSRATGRPWSLIQGAICTVRSGACCARRAGWTKPRPSCGKRFAAYRRTRGRILRWRFWRCGGTVEHLGSALAAWENADESFEAREAREKLAELGG